MLLTSIDSTVDRYSFDRSPRQTTSGAKDRVACDNSRRIRASRASTALRPAPAGPA
jgi:hypothetical protein